MRRHLFFLKRCYALGLVDKVVENGKTTYSSEVLNFMPIYQRFGNLDCLPEEGRKSINKWYHGQYTAKRRPLIEQLMKGIPVSELGMESASTAIPLLNEAEEIIDGATDIAIVPCNCRRFGRNCD